MAHAIYYLYKVRPGFWIDVVLELLFALVIFIVGLLAYRVYRLTGKNQTRLFAVSFFFISIGYMVQSILNLFILFELNKSVSHLINLQNILVFDTLGQYVHVFFMITGFMLLLYTTLKAENAGILWLIFGITAAGIFFSQNRLFLSLIMIAIFTGFIAIHYIDNLLKSRSIKKLQTALAFSCLFLGRLLFIFLEKRTYLYHAGHALEFLAYGFIIINLLSLKNEQKKRPA